MGPDGNLESAIPLTAIMAVTLLVLFKRRIEWQRWAACNGWIVAFLAFAALSVLWSDYSEVAAKRWIRGCGTVLAVSLVLSERDPVVTIAAVLRRTALVFVPLSIALILFLPDRGVIHEAWQGTSYPVGMTTDKNSLGRYSMIVALVAIWSLMSRQRLGAAQRDRISIAMEAFLLGGSLYLLLISRSATALACFISGSVLLAAACLPAARRNPTQLVWGLVLFAGVAALLALLGTLSDIYAQVAAALGRDPTLTGRVYIWRDLLDLRTNPIVGVGYGSFWLGDRLAWFLEEHNVASAHNGFLEVYLGMGITGVLLLVLILHSALRVTASSLVSDEAYGRLRLAFVVVFILYNMAEAATLLTSPMMFLLLLVAIRPPAPSEEAAARYDQSGANLKLPASRL
jgi:O-antigen ligase